MAERASFPGRSSRWTLVTEDVAVRLRSARGGAALTRCTGTSGDGGSSGARFAFVLYVYARLPGASRGLGTDRPRPVRARRRSRRAVDRHRRTERGGGRCEDAIDNLLALDYPADRIQIIVVSDGSTDPDGEILSLYDGRWTRFCCLRRQGERAQRRRRGRAARRARLHGRAADVAPDALRALVAPLADPAVGGVSGELRPRLRIGQRRRRRLAKASAPTGVTRSGCAATRAWSARRSVRPARSTPFAASCGSRSRPKRFSTTCLRRCRRCWPAPGSSSRRRRGPSTAWRPSRNVEFQRKTRTLAGNYQILRLEPRLLVPFVNPVWLQFVSHKLGRLIVPYALCAHPGVERRACGSTLFSMPWRLSAQLAFYGLAMYGAVLERRGRQAAPAARRDPCRDVRGVIHE